MFGALFSLYHLSTLFLLALFAIFHSFGIVPYTRWWFGDISHFILMHTGSRDDIEHKKGTQIPAKNWKQYNWKENYTSQCSSWQWNVTYFFLLASYSFPFSSCNIVYGSFDSNDLKLSHAFHNCDLELVFFLVAFASNQTSHQYLLVEQNNVWFYRMVVQLCLKYKCNKMYESLLQKWQATNRMDDTKRDTNQLELWFCPQLVAPRISFKKFINYVTNDGNFLIKCTIGNWTLGVQQTLILSASPKIPK